LFTLKSSIPQTALSSAEQIGTKRPRQTTVRRVPLIAITTNQGNQSYKRKRVTYKNKSFMYRLLRPKRPKKSVAVLVSPITASKKRAASGRFDTSPITRSRKLSRLSLR
jgi:hypothetical protein